MPIRGSGNKRKENRSLSLNAKQQREALHLWRNSGMSAREIGERYGVGIDVIYELTRQEL